MSDEYLKYKEFIQYQQSSGNNDYFGWDHNIKEFYVSNISLLYDNDDTVNNIIKIECKYKEDSIVYTKSMEYYKKTFDDYIIKIRDEKLKELGL